MKRSVRRSACAAATLLVASGAYAALSAGGGADPAEALVATVRLPAGSVVLKDPQGLLLSRPFGDLRPEYVAVRFYNVPDAFDAVTSFLMRTPQHGWPAGQPGVSGSTTTRAVTAETFSYDAGHDGGAGIVITAFPAGGRTHLRVDAEVPRPPGPVASYDPRVDPSISHSP